MSDAIGDDRDPATKGFERRERSEFGNHHVGGAQQLLDFVRVADYFDRELRFGSQQLRLVSQFFVLTGEKNRLHVKPAAD